MPKRKKTLGIVELLDMFPDEESARKRFEDLRWPMGTEIALIVEAVIQTPFLARTLCRTIAEAVISISVSEPER